MECYIERLKQTLLEGDVYFRYVWNGGLLTEIKTAISISTKLY